MVVFDRLWSGRAVTEHKYVFLVFFFFFFLYPRSPKGEGVYCFTSVRLSVRLAVLPSVQDICRRIFLSNCWWQKFHIWSQASYRYTILWVVFFYPSDSYFLFADFADFYAHWTYILYMPMVVAFFSASIDGRNLIFGHKLHIGTPYRGKRFFSPSDSYFLFDETGVS